MAAATTNINGNSVRQPAKLSSGIMGMKFMRKDDNSSNAADSNPATVEEKSTKPSPNVFKQEKDPGEWFSPAGTSFKLLAQKETSESLGFGDIYGSSQEVTGRRTYGASAKSSSAEEMADSDHSATKTQRYKTAKLKTPKPGLKRSSDTELESPKSSTGKRRKSSK